eukprot:6213413-Pleurochrysis_carterae.AAC.2
MVCQADRFNTRSLRAALAAQFGAKSLRLSSVYFLKVILCTRRSAPSRLRCRRTPPIRLRARVYAAAPFKRTLQLDSSLFNAMRIPFLAKVCLRSIGI